MIICIISFDADWIAEKKRFVNILEKIFFDKKYRISSMNTKFETSSSWLKNYLYGQIKKLIINLSYK